MLKRECADVLQPDLKWCGGLTEAVKIYTLAEAAGLQTIPHGGANSPFGQHFALAMPECVPTPAECLEEMVSAAAASGPAEIALVPEPQEWKATADWLQRAASRDFTGLAVRAPRAESAPRGEVTHSAKPRSSRGSADRFSR